MDKRSGSYDWMAWMTGRETAKKREARQKEKERIEKEKIWFIEQLKKASEAELNDICIKLNSFVVPDYFVSGDLEKIKQNMRAIYRDEFKLEGDDREEAIDEVYRACKKTELVWNWIRRLSHRKHKPLSAEEREKKIQLEASKGSFFDYPKTLNTRYIDTGRQIPPKPSLDQIEEEKE